MIFGNSDQKSKNRFFKVKNSNFRKKNYPSISKTLRNPNHLGTKIPLDFKFFLTILYLIGRRSDKELWIYFRNGIAAAVLLLLLLMMFASFRLKIKLENFSQNCSRSKTVTNIQNSPTIVTHKSKSRKKLTFQRL